MRLNFSLFLAAAIVIGLTLPLCAQQEHGPYARISFLRTHEGDLEGFESGYIRHLAWHRQAKDAWSWYGWTVWAGDRQGQFVYATFGHSAASLDHPVDPAGDQRDSFQNVWTHCEPAGGALYEFLPALSKGSGEPQPALRMEMTIIEIAASSQNSFELALHNTQQNLKDETLWYRMVAGGSAPRYVRLRPAKSFEALLAGKSEQPIPERMATKVQVEILTLRPTMTYNLSVTPAAPPESAGQRPPGEPVEPPGPLEILCDAKSTCDP